MDQPADQSEQDPLAALRAGYRPRDLSGETVATFIEIEPDGTVTVYCGKVELGTGLATAMAQIVAGELGVPVERVRMVMGDTALTPDQGTTAGSKSIQIAGPILRQAAAMAREELVERAAARLEVSPRDLVIEDGMARPIDRSLTGIPIGDLATGHLTHPLGEPHMVEATPAPGISTPRIDLLGKLTGAPAFVHDLVLPGMLHGRVIRPYVRTMEGSGSVVDVDDAEALAMPGVVAVVRDGDFLGVVAEREEQATHAAEAVGVTWADAEPLSSLDEFHRRMREAVIEEREIDTRGDVDAALASADQALTATYAFPCIAHASMGPSCAVADVREDRATVWSSTQGVYALRNSLAPLLGLPEERVRVIHAEGSGCYGHNGADDVAADAALLSRAVGRPVRVQWMRREEFAWEPKSPAMVVDMAAGLDATGNVTAWTHDVWTPTHVMRPNGQPDKLLAGQEVSPTVPVTPVRYGGGDRNAPVTYAFPDMRTTVHWVGESPLRPSALRSLGGTHNTTANEMFLDEIAAAAGVDPVELRLRALDDPRAVAVVEAAARKAGWGTPSPSVDGMATGRGFAFVRYEMEYAYVATVAEVAVDPATGEVRVTRVVIAHDCGRIVNPDGVANQVEGNVIQGVSRALKEQVTWDDREVTSLTWESYPILTFTETPEIDVVLIDRPEEPSLGAGEPAICTVPAAIGNAIFDATGVRPRELPFTPGRVRAAMNAG